MACEFPSENITIGELRDILEESKTVAIVGLSPKPEKDSNRVAKYLQQNGYKIYPIYPKEETILGEKVYRSLSEIEDDIDIVNIFRKPEIVASVVDEAIEKKNIKTIWTQLGIVNNEAIKRAKDAGFKTVQNHCTKIEHQKLQEG